MLREFSANGRYIAFQSYADNLVDNDNNHKVDVFVHDRTAGVTSLVSVNSNGGQGEQDSTSPNIGSNRRYVAFMSSSRNFRDKEILYDDAENVFVRDRQTATTTWVSRNPNGGQAGSNKWSAWYPSISGNGRYVVFDSPSPDLVDGEATHDLRDVFLYSRNRPPETYKERQVPLNPIPINEPTLILGYTGDPEFDPRVFSWVVTQQTPGSSYQYNWNNNNDRFWNYFTPLTKGKFKVRVTMTDQPPYPDIEPIILTGWFDLKAGSNSEPHVEAGPDQVISLRSSGLKMRPPGGIDLP